MIKNLKWNIAQFGEIRWWKKYLKNKKKEKYLDWKRKYWQNLLDQLSDVVKIDSTQTILDAGCGPSGIFIVLQHCQTIAVDPLLEEYDKYLIQFKKHNYPSVTFITTPIEQIDLPEKVDLVFCMNVINHVQNLEHCYDTFITTLKPGGKLIISIDCHNYRFFKWLFRIIPGDLLHPYQFELKEYETFLTDRNMKMLKTICIKKEFFFTHYIQVAIK